MRLKEGEAYKFNISNLNTSRVFEPIIPPPIEVREGPFVGREEVLKIFTNMADNFLASFNQRGEQQDNHPRQRFFQVIGLPGMGKRSLMERIVKSVREKYVEGYGYDVYYVNFRCQPTEVESTINTLKELESKHPGAKITLRKDGGINAEYDHTEPPYFLFVIPPISLLGTHIFDRDILQAHAYKKNAFIGIGTSKSRLHPWLNPILRSPAYAVFHHLGPFSQEETTQQMESLGYEGDPTKIHKITDGHPLANALIASGIPPQQAISIVIKYVIQNNNNDVDGNNDPEFIHELLRVLSVPKNGFNEEIAKALIVNCEEEPLATTARTIIKDDSALNYQTTIHAIQPLHSANLLPYRVINQGARFCLDATLRKLLQRDLAFNNPDLFIKLHSILSKLYTNFALQAQDETGRTYWSTLAKYHQEVAEAFSKSGSILELGSIL